MAPPRDRASVRGWYSLRRLAIICALLAVPTILLGPAMPPSRALLPADLLVQFEPWRSQLAEQPEAHWDALVWDGIAQYYPWRVFAAETLRSGHLPLWNPYQFCGTPFLANGQSAVLYPLNLLFWLLPVAIAFVWSAWLHLILTGWFVYLFLRRVGVSRPGAVAAAVVWQGNSFTVAWIHLPTTLCTVAWLPLILLCCDRALLAGRLRYAVCAGLALGLSYLGGHPQVFLYVALMAAVYLLARGLSRAVTTTIGRRLARLAATGAIIGGLALGVAAAQLLPTAEFLSVAHRMFTPGPESYAAFLKRALQSIQLGSLVLPHPLGNPAAGTYLGPENYAEYAIYLGLLALSLALWGAVSSPVWPARFLAVAGVVALLGALGTIVNWPMYHWVPGVANTGGPARLVLLYVFCFSLLAGLGVDLVSQHVREGRARRAVFAVLLALIGPLTLVIMFINAVSGRVPELKGALRGDLVASGAVVIALFLLAMLTVSSPRRAAALPIGLVALLSLDLLLAARGHLHVSPRDWVYAEPANPGSVSGRVIGNAADWPSNRFPNAVLPPNAAMVYHLRDTGGYDSLYLARYRDFASLIQGGDPSPALNGNMLLPRLEGVYDLAMIRLAGVDTILSPTALPNLPLDRAGAYSTYAPLGAWPRAWIAQSAVFAFDWQQAQRSMVLLGALPDCLIITGPDQPAETFRPGSRPIAQLTDVSPNAARVDLPRGGGGYLFLADTYGPGWRAYAGGRELPIRAAYLTFRAVPLSRDISRVEFRYEPTSFRVGLFISLLALAAVVATLLSARVRGNA